MYVPCKKEIANREYYVGATLLKKKKGQVYKHKNADDHVVAQTKEQQLFFWLISSIST